MMGNANVEGKERGMGEWSGVRLVGKDGLGVLLAPRETKRRNELPVFSFSLFKFPPDLFLFSLLNTYPSLHSPLSTRIGRVQEKASGAPRCCVRCAPGLGIWGGSWCGEGLGGRGGGWGWGMGQWSEVRGGGILVVGKGKWWGREGVVMRWRVEESTVLQGRGKGKSCSEGYWGVIESLERKRFGCEKHDVDIQLLT